MPTKKKSKKDTAVEEVKVVKEAKAAPAPTTPPVKFRPVRMITAKQYLVRAKTKPHHIAPLVAAANSKGHTLATVAQWKEIFKGI